MPPSSEYFGERLNDQYRDHNHLIASVFIGVVLAGAAVSLLAILASDEAPAAKIAALGLWLGSFGSLICTYNGPIVNSILITRPPTLVDVVTPFLVGVMGFAQFVVILPAQAVANGPVPPAPAQLDHLTWWFLVAAGLWVVVFPNLSSTLAQIRATVGESPPDLVPLVRWCEGIVRTGRRGTVAIVVTLAGVFWLLRADSTAALRRWQAVLGVAYFAGMVGLIMIQERARRTMAASVAPEAPVP